ncbi:transmembrane 9 superfamily member 2 isoform X1 [Capsicum annuum]
MALVGVFYPYKRGALYTALLVIYALTFGVAGYTSTSFYCQLEGTNWVKNLVWTGCLFCVPLALTFCFLNSVAVSYSSTAALPFGTIMLIVLMWTLVTSTLLVLGGIAVKNSSTGFQFPCRTTKNPREIPVLPWYHSTIPQMVMTGFLPFNAIYIEFYYIFESVWGQKIYTIYRILFIVFILLLIVTAIVTVASTYFQLATEDHKWWWSVRQLVQHQLCHLEDASKAPKNMNGKKFSGEQIRVDYLRSQPIRRISCFLYSKEQGPEFREMRDGLYPNRSIGYPDTQHMPQDFVRNYSDPMQGGLLGCLLNHVLHKVLRLYNLINEKGKFCKLLLALNYFPLHLHLHVWTSFSC